MHPVVRKLSIFVDLALDEQRPVVGLFGSPTTVSLHQEDPAYADAIGSSAVLWQLRSEKRIAFGDKRMTSLDLRRLEEHVGFDPNHRHLQAPYRAPAIRDGGPPAVGRLRSEGEEAADA